MKTVIISQKTVFIGIFAFIALFLATPRARMERTVAREQTRSAAVAAESGTLVREPISPRVIELAEKRRGAVDPVSWSMRLAVGVPVSEEEVAPGVFARAEGRADDFRIFWRIAPGVDPDAVRLAMPENPSACRVMSPTALVGKSNLVWKAADEFGVARLVSGVKRFGEWTEFQTRAIVPLANLSVTNLNDSGPGSLREAIIAANGTPEADVITISVVGTLFLLNRLPDITSAVAIDGPGASQFFIRRDVGGLYGVFSVPLSTTPVSFSGLNIQDGQGAIFGGGINTFSAVTVSRCTIQNNLASNGGGGIVFGPSNSNLFIDSTFLGNAAGVQGGGINNEGATLRMVNCTVVGNLASGLGFGAGILNLDTASGLADTTMTNCTFSFNVSQTPANGLAICNRATTGTATTRYRNTIFNGPFPQVANLSAGGLATVVSLGNNLSTEGSGNLTAPGDLPSTNPLLSGVANHGGETATLTPLPGSPAINAGNNCVLTNNCASNNVGVNVTTDQRGIARPQQGTVDIGAVESRGFSLASAGGSNQTTAVGTAFANPLAVTVTSAFGEPVELGQVRFTAPGSGASCAIVGNPATVSLGSATTGTVMANLTPGGPYTVTATANGAPTGVNFSLTNTFVCPTIAIAPPTLPNGTVGTAYSQSLTPSGGTAPYNFSVMSGSLPPGISLTGGGTLAGTPFQTGTYNFTVRAIDSTAPPGPCSGTRSYTVVINCPAIAVNPTGLPNGTAGTPYSQTVSATGTLAAANFSVSAGMLPTGLTLAPTTGLLSGTPTATGTFNFTVRATDTNAGSNTCFGERAYTVTIACPTITVTPTGVPAGVAGTAYPGTSFLASGATGPYGFTLVGGALPAGMSFASGALVGTPTVVGTFNFTIRATDTNPGTNTCFGERTYSLLITCPTIAVNPVTLPPATLGTAYGQTVTASGGIAPYAFTVTAGMLPAGLTLSSGGVLSGMPTTAGTFAFTVTATDANGCTGTRSYTVQVGGVELSLLYVADTDNSRIQVFDGNVWTLAPRTAGVVGGAAGQFRSPEGVTATRTNQIYVADTGNNRVHWYDGFTWSDFATLGSGPNQVRAPQAVAIDVTGQFLFVADTGNNRILRFNANAPNSTAVVLANPGGLPGQVTNPRGLAIDNLGNLFIADTGNSRILRIANATTVTTADTGTVVTTAFRAPEGVALDNDGNLYIADTGNSRILQLPGGAPGTPTVLAVLGTALGSVRSPEGLTVTNFAAGPLAGRNLLVGDTANSRIQARTLAGGVWSLVGGTGSALGQFRSPSKIR